MTTILEVPLSDCHLTQLKQFAKTDSNKKLLKILKR